MSDKELLETIPIEEGSAEAEVQVSTAAPPTPDVAPGLFSIAPLSKSFTSAALDALSMARTVGKTDPVNKSLLRVQDVEITHAEASKLGIGEQKLLRYAVSMFTRENAENEKTPKLRVYGSTRDFANACITDPEKGINPRTMATPEAQEKENRRAAKALDNFKTKLRKNAEALRVAGFRWTETTKGKRKAYSGLSFISYYRVDDEVVTIEFSQAAAEMLVQRPLTETPRALYAISDNNPNAYSIAEQMAKHYAIHNNVMVNTEQVLKVSTLLSYTTLSRNIGTTTRYRYKWESRIKEPFEAALDELTVKGFFEPFTSETGERLNWMYCRAGQEPLTDEEVMSISSYEQWLSLYVKFQLSDFAPHEERRKIIADRKEAQKTQAEEKRKRRRSKAKDDMQDTPLNM